MIQMIEYRDFMTRFKLIRKERDLHFGEHLLMKDLLHKRKVIVKSLKVNTTQQLQQLLQPIQELTVLNKHPDFAHFLGCSLQNSKFLYLIYEHHQHTLQESIKQMNLHNNFYSEGEALHLLQQVSSALMLLQSSKLSHGDLRSAYILQQKRGTLQHCFKLLFTNFIVKSSEQLIRLATDPQIYNLPPEVIAGVREGRQFEASPQLDIYALGMIILSTIVKKQKAWTLKKRLKVAVERCPRISELLLRMLSDDPSLRFKSIRELRQSFQYIGDLSSNSRSISLDRSRESNIQQLKSKKQKDRLPSNQGSKSRFRRQLKLLEERVLFDQSGEQIKNITKKVYADHSYYVGQLEGQLRQGKGIYYYSEGDVYAGEWKANVLDGKGIYLYETGQMYTGDVRSGAKNGSGVYTYLNGNVYDGNWKDDLKDGFGEYRYSSGQVYRGNFVKGQKSGQGILNYPDGTLLQGTWEDNLLHGPVIIQYANQCSWQGTYLKNMKQSGGQFTFKGGKMLDQQQTHVEWNTGQSYKGRLNRGLPHQKGLYDFGEGDIYEGNFQQGQFQGQGVLRWNGLLIEGKWDSHKLVMAKIRLANGDEYMGEVRNGQFQGRGQYRFGSGQTFIGNFQGGRAKQGYLRSGLQEIAIN